MYNKKVIGWVFVLVLLLAGACYLYYLNLEPSTKSNDIEIVGTVEPYEHEYYDYLVTIEMNRKKHGYSVHMVYPIIPGLHGINFIQEPGYFTPSSIGSRSDTDELLRGIYREEEQFMGFAIPEEEGVYQVKFLLNATETFTGIEEAKIYYVHVEEKLGKDLSWIQDYNIEVLVEENLGEND